MCGPDRVDAHGTGGEERDIGVSEAAEKASAAAARRTTTRLVSRRSCGRSPEATWAITMAARRADPAPFSRDAARPRGPDAVSDRAFRGRRDTGRPDPPVAGPAFRVRVRS
jgi:hypothetical protein